MRKLVLPLAPLLTLALSCSGKETSPAGAEYRAEIRRTSFGVPHVTADDFAGPGYGIGYAAGQDYGCYLADQMVKIQSRRAVTFGPGDKDANVDSDFAYLATRVEETAAAELPKQPQDVRDLLEGYAAG